MTTPARTPFRAGRVMHAAAVPPRPASTPAPAVYLADISEWEPQLADAAYLAWSQAVIIRAAYGDAHDDRAWYGGQRRAFLHAGGARFLGIYQYLVAGQDGGAQARAFHSLVGAIQPGEVFIADFEEGAKPVLSAWYAEMTRLYGAAIGPYLWTYSGLFFGQAAGLAPWQWLADYTGTEPSSPAHLLWQFTDAFTVPGLLAPADCSVYRGTIGQLAARAWPATVPLPGPQPVPAPLPPPFRGEYITGGMFDLDNLALKLGVPVHALLASTAAHYGGYDPGLAAWLDQVAAGPQPASAPVPAGVRLWVS